MPMPPKLSDADLAALSRFDYVSEESLTALSRLGAGTRTMVIQSCATNPKFDDVDLYYLAMSELSDLQVEAEAATAAAAVLDASADHQDAGESMINMEPPVDASADHQDAGESMINMEPPVDASADHQDAGESMINMEPPVDASADHQDAGESMINMGPPVDASADHQDAGESMINMEPPVDASADHQDAGESMINMEPPVAPTTTIDNRVPKGRRGSNNRRPVVTFTVAMKDHHQKKPVHSDSDTLQRPPFNMIETQASLSRPIRPTIPTLFGHVCRKRQNLAIDTDRERATTTTMIAKRTTKKRSNDKGKATGRWGPSTSSSTDERIESQRSITALELTKLVALTESPPPPPPDQVCHNQETTLAIQDECVKTVIKKTKIKLRLKKRAIDFEYQEENSSTTAKKRIIKLETATEAPPTAPAPPKVCSHQETALAISDDERLTVKKAERAYGMKRAIDFEYSDQEDLYKASTSSKKRVIKKKNTLENNVVQLPHPPPDLTAELRERIIALQGTDPVLVIQKALYSTDVNPVQCRLSLPLAKVNPEFLSPEETATLATRHGSEVPEIKVQLIEPSGHVREMSLKKWDMKKDSGTVNSTYNLVSGWKDVVRDNDLQAGMIMQLWSFQVGSRRWFALVKVESDEGHVGSIN